MSAPVVTIAGANAGKSTAVGVSAPVSGADAADAGDGAADPAVDVDQHGRVRAPPPASRFRRPIRDATRRVYESVLQLLLRLQVAAMTPASTKQRVPGVSNPKAKVRCAGVLVCWFGVGDGLYTACVYW